MRWAFVGALGAHLALAGLLFLQWQPTQQVPHKVGNTIEAYIKIQAADIGITHQEAITQTAGNHTVTQHTAPSQLRQGQHKQLLILLHDQLQNSINQTPLDIPQFMQVTPVKLCFTLQKNGRIKNIQLKQGSNVHRLTQLSLLSLKQLSPVSHARNFIHQMTRYCVAINR